MTNDGYPSPLEPHGTKEQLLDIAKRVANYAENNFNNGNRHRMRNRFRALNLSWQGIVNPAEVNMINREYGVDNKVQYIDYNITKSKILTMHGEFIKTPMRSVVSITNKEVIVDKHRRRTYLKGMMIAKDAIAELNQKGFDPTNGMVPPQTEEEIDKIMKDTGLKAERIMQYYLLSQTNNNKLKKKLGECYLRAARNAEAFMRIYLDHNGKTQTDPIKPENAIFEEIEGDDFLTESRYIGQRIRMTYGQALQKMNLTETQKEELKQGFGGSIDTQGAYFMNNPLNNHEVEVYHLEWYMFVPKVSKVMVNPATGQEEEYLYDEKTYAKKKSQIANEVKNGKYKIITRYKKYWYEMYHVPGTDIYTNVQRVQNQIFKWDQPWEAYSTYTGYLYGTEEGIRKGLFEELEPIKKMYNVCRFQMNRELYKIKGSAITYNRAFLPTDDNGNPLKMGVVVSRLINDGIYDFNSSGAGNLGGRDIDVKDAIQVLDLGPSKSLGMLINICYNIEALLNMVSPVNDNRQGDTSASETVTNAQSDIASSMTITEPFNFGFDMFIEDVCMRICEVTKLSWTLHPEYALPYLNEEALSDLEELKELGWYDYQPKLIDTRKEAKMRSKISEYIANSLQQKTITPQSAIAAEFKETVAEAYLELKKGWDDVQKVLAEERDAAMKMEQEKNKFMLEREDAVREDMQAHDIEKLKVKGGQDTNKAAQNAGNQAVLAEQQKNNQLQLQK